jgi:hypothetical protein
MNLGGYINHSRDCCSWLSLPLRAVFFLALLEAFFLDFAAVFAFLGIGIRDLC